MEGGSKAIMISTSNTFDRTVRVTGLSDDEANELLNRIKSFFSFSGISVTRSHTVSLCVEGVTQEYLLRFIQNVLREKGFTIFTSVV